MAIAVAWNVPSAHAVHALSDVAVPAVAKYVPAVGHAESMVPAHADTGVLSLMAIAVAWNVPSAHAEHALSDVAVPAVAKYVPDVGHTERHGEHVGFASEPV
jgi:hypothetical protein